MSRRNMSPPTLLQTSLAAGSGSASAHGLRDIEHAFVSAVAEARRVDAVKVDLELMLLSLDHAGRQRLVEDDEHAQVEQA